jgi:hypothetical protein
VTTPLEGLLDVTNPHRNVKPVENMTDRLSRRADDSAFERGIAVTETLMSLPGIQPWARKAARTA